jgi:DNA-binding protein
MVKFTNDFNNININNSFDNTEIKNNDFFKNIKLKQIETGESTSLFLTSYI